MGLRNALRVSGGVSVASMPSGTPPGLTDRGSGYANTIHSYPTRSARFADLRDHAASCTPSAGAIAPMPWRHLTPYRGGCPAELPTSDLAADYSLALTSRAYACCCSSPTLAGVTRASNDAPAAKVACNVSLQSPISPPGGHALGEALCCGRHP